MENKVNNEQYYNFIQVLEENTNNITCSRDHDNLEWDSNLQNKDKILNTKEYKSNFVKKIEWMST